jgi:hypothetical protein
MTIEELSDVLESPARARAALRWLHGQEALPPALPEAIPGVSPESWAKLRQVLIWPSLMKTAKL